MSQAPAKRGHTRVGEEPAPGAGRRWPAWWVLALTAGLFALLIVQHSLRSGKLLLLPTYDDVEYLNAGLRLLTLLDTHGLKRFAAEVLLHPGHAPYSTLTAVLGYTLFGVQQWAPYLVNALPVLALLLLTRGLLLGAPPAVILAWLAVTLTLPFSGRLVSEFRPDLVCGMLAALGVVRLVTSPLLGSDRARLMTTGLCFGLALLVKPSVFAATLAYLGAALAVATTRDLLLGGRLAAWRSLAAAWGWCLLPPLALFLPYLAITRGGAVEYMFSNVWGDYASYLHYRGGFWASLPYYLTGPGGQFTLGRHLYLLGLVIVLGAWGVIRRGDRAQRLGLLGLVVAAALVYAVPLFNNERQRFFGSAFSMTVFFWATHQVAAWWRAKAVPLAPDRLRPLLFGLGLAGLLLVYWPDYQPADQGRAIRAFQERVQDAVLASQPRPGARVFVTTVGATNASTIQYGLLRDGRPDVQVVDLHRSKDLEQYRQAEDRSDYVVARDPRAGRRAGRLPCGEIEEQSLHQVAHRTDFQRVAAIDDPHGGVYHVFRRITDRP